MSEAGLWRHAGFRRLYGSMLAFVLGTQVYQLALPLILYELTHSAATMTTMRAVELLPNLLLAMFIGVWVDRIDRVRWARLAIAGMVLLMAAQALMLGMQLAIGYFFVSAFALMTLNYLFAICRMAVIKDMLPAPLLLPATGQLSVLTEVFSVLGPALAGGLLAWHLEAGLWVPMAAWLLAALGLRGVAPPHSPKPAAGFWVEWWEGWRTLKANKPLWQLSWLVVLMNGSVGVVEVLFIFRARDELGWSPGQLGLIYALAGVGGVLGGLWCSRLRQRIGLGRVLTLSVALEAIAMLGLAFAQAVPLLVAALFVKNLGTVLGNVCVWGFRQESTDSAFIGRVSGLTGSLFKLLMPFALLLSGAASSSWPLAALLAACAGLHGVALLGMRWSAVYPVR
ncbi:MFS family permease [Inhella inkyongensis]|uniref:MFS family permease n=1 Tax=Inhella inkyongensis TaxID=392593 RepID=A0A840S016_9BURK|nr:MFS transporter [Inhella inkyongensis]MBB5203595.1 MFS family permease [Inhella inkyongensis]